MLASYTPETAAQEMAALLLALAVLVAVRCEAAERGAVDVLRVRFRRVLRLVRALWTRLEIGEGIHTPQQMKALVSRTLERATALVRPERRVGSCPRAVRQPVGFVAASAATARMERRNSLGSHSASRVKIITALRIG